jgi:hypothetical protein
VQSRRRASLAGFSVEVDMMHWSHIRNC